MRILRFLPIALALALLLFIPSGNTSASSISLVINNPVCVQPKPDSGTCYILTRGIFAGGSGASFSRLEVMIDGNLRVNMQGFFESTADLYPAMLGDGLAVACGMPNASGNPAFGKIYTLYIAASMSDGANTWGSAVVSCPYYDGKVYVPSIQR